MGIALREYQTEAVESVLRELETHRSTLFVIPTGGGKTIVFSEIARRWRPQGRTLVLAHREELVRQAADKIAKTTGLTAGVEMADSRAADSLFGVSTDVVCGSIQTFSRPQRREVYRPDAFSLVVVDEAHHAPAASYRQVVDYFAGARLVGCTATPDRADETALGNVFESVAITVEIRDLIDLGFLAPIRQFAIEVNGLDFSKARTTAGDLNEGDLEEILIEEEMLHKVASPTVENAGARPTVIFGPTVAYARALAEVINRSRPAQAVAMDGTMDRETRARLLSSYARGDFQYLVNCSLFTEGWDCPSVACVAIARPTKSRALYTQMVGRGTRTAPGKTDLLVLDFQGNAGRHKLVCPADILGGKEDEEVLARAKEILGSAGGRQKAVHDAIDEARKDVAQKKLRANVIAHARSSRWEVDPFDAFGITAPRTSYAGQPARPDQVERLVQKGIKPEDAARMGRSEATALIGEMNRRFKAGLCTLKQARVLARAGLRTDVSFADAGFLITNLAGNSWRPTEWMRAEWSPRRAA